MRYILAAAIVLVCSVDAHAQVTCQRYGNQTYCSNGLSSQQYGNQTYYNNGVTAQQYGNQTYYTAPTYVPTPPPVYQPLPPLQPYRPYR